MNRIIILLAFLGFIAKADNEIYINQVGSDLNLDVEQLGGSNLIGGLDAVSGQMTAKERKIKLQQLKHICSLCKMIIVRRSWHLRSSHCACKAFSTC